jgi:hypothetical protein
MEMTRRPDACGVRGTAGATPGSSYRSAQISETSALAEHRDAVPVVAEHLILDAQTRLGGKLHHQFGRNRGAGTAVSLTSAAVVQPRRPPATSSSGICAT